jgi:signal transduction histidine kinase
MTYIFQRIRTSVSQFILSVPVRWKILGIGILPVIILGLSLNYWIVTGLSDWLSYLLTDTRVRAAMGAGSRSVIFVTVIAAFLSIILLLLLVDILTTPLDALKKTAEEVAEGKFDSRATVWANDEIGSLAESVNQMISNLVAQQESLSKTNLQLSIINKISIAADRENEIHDVLFIALESILEMLGLEFGWVYLYDPEVDRHHLASWKNVPSDLEQILLNVEPENLCSSQTRLVTQTLENEIFVRSCERLRMAGYEGDQSRHITIPIIARDIQFGTLNLHYPFDGDLEQDNIELLSSIGAKLSEIVANAWLQFKLHEKEAARQLLLESLVTAQEDERSHLARELHDQAGQSLTSLLIRLKDLEKYCSEGGQKQKLADMQSLVSATIDQIRDLSYSLRPPALEEFGLGAAINSLADDLSIQSGVRIKFKNRLDEKVSRNIETVLYRIVQEGLTNVIRHANANLVKIELELREKQLYLMITDNGKGFDPAKISPPTGTRHLGLISMHERAELIGGQMEMYSKIGEGTTIEVKVPLSQLEMLHG